MIWVLAFSIQDQVEKYGAYVAIASFIGLALLSVLYFAQAREVRRLRDWAGRAPERDRELAERVTANADAARRVQAQPAPVQDTVVAAPVVAPAGAEPVNGHPAPAAVPMGPRPATAAALVAAAVSSAAAPAEEVADEPEAADEQAGGAEPPAGDSAESPPGAGGESPAGEAGAPAAEAGAAAGETGAPGGSAAPAPAATNGHGDQETGEQAVAEAEKLPPVPRATPRQAPRRSAQAQPLRATQRSTTVPPRRTPPARPRTTRPPAQPPRRAPEPRRSSTGLLVGGLLGLLVIAVVALFATGVLGGGGNEPAPVGGGAAPTPTASPSASSPAARAAATVVVLNGTTVDGLAASEKAKLEQAGYRDVQTTTSENQAEQGSTVTYASGERRQALDVARLLGVGSVRPLDADTQSLANNSFAKPVEADVVVVAGADQAP